jgi:hypothetical protein
MRSPFRRTLALLAFLAAVPACDTLGRGSGGPSPTSADARAGRAIPSIDLTISDQARETFFGRVTLQPAEAGADIVVSLDGMAAAADADGYADQVFVMIRSAGSGRIENMQIESARVTYRGRGVVVESMDGRYTVGFFLRGERGAEVREEMGRGRRFNQVWNVVGISRRTGQWRVDGDGLDAAGLHDVMLSCGNANGTVRLASLGTCDSGGPGAVACSTSCSLSGGNCSVQCEGGSYSCCSKVECECTCVTPPPPPPPPASETDPGSGSGGGSEGSGDCGLDGYVWYYRGGIACKSYSV